MKPSNLTNLFKATFTTLGLVVASLVTAQEIDPQEQVKNDPMFEIEMYGCSPYPECADNESVSYFDLFFTSEAEQQSEDSED